MRRGGRLRRRRYVWRRSTAEVRCSSPSPPRDCSSCEAVARRERWQDPRRRRPCHRRDPHVRRRRQHRRRQGSPRRRRRGAGGLGSHGPARPCGAAAGGIREAHRAGRRVRHADDPRDGKTLAESRGEVAYGAEFFRWFSEEAVRIRRSRVRTPRPTSKIQMSLPSSDGPLMLAAAQQPSRRDADPPYRPGSPGRRRCGHCGRATSAATAFGRPSDTPAHRWRTPKTHLHHCRY